MDFHTHEQTSYRNELNFLYWNSFFPRDKKVEDFNSAPKGFPPELEFFGDVQKPVNNFGSIDSIR